MAKDSKEGATVTSPVATTAAPAPTGFKSATEYHTLHACPLVQPQKVECADFDWLNKVTGKGCIVGATKRDDVDKKTGKITANEACCHFGGGNYCEGAVKLDTLKQKVQKKDAIVNYKCV